jgi:hypothetical protein
MSYISMLLFVNSYVCIVLACVSDNNDQKVSFELESIFKHFSEVHTIAIHIKLWRQHYIV